jgi:hypothetical protein
MRRFRRLAAALPVVAALALALALREGGPTLPDSLPEPVLDAAAGVSLGLSRGVEDLASRAAASLGAAIEAVDEAPVIQQPSPKPPPPVTVPPLPTLTMRDMQRPVLPRAPRRLVGGGCCPGAWWSAASTHLLYIDRPPGAPATALYTVPVWPPGAPPEVADARVSEQAGAARMRVYVEEGRSIVRDLETDEQWAVPTNGNPMRLSPDGSQAVWWEATGTRRDVDGINRVWSAPVRGGEPVELAALWGLAVVDFLPDNRHVLAVGRPFRERPLFSLLRLDTQGGEMVELARGEWLSDALLSPNGRWVVYLTSLDRQNPQRNGVWVVGTEGDAYGSARKLDFTGAYRWRDGEHLLYVPLEMDAPSHEVWEMAVETGQSRLLLGEDLGIRIASNDWSVSPDGGSLAWLDERERDLWLVDLP